MAAFFESGLAFDLILAALAVEIDRTIHRSQPDFEPGGEGRRIPYSTSYRLGYRLMGFRLAEKLAGWQRGKEQA